MVEHKPPQEASLIGHAVDLGDKVKVAAAIPAPANATSVVQTQKDVKKEVTSIVKKIPDAVQSTKPGAS